MKDYRKNSVLAHILWEKKQDTKRDFFHNLMQLQKQTMQRKIELLVSKNGRNKSESPQVIH